MTLADLFTLTTLTDSINKLQRAPSVLGDSGLFDPDKGVSTTSILVDSKDGRLSLVPAVGRDDDPTPVKDAKRTRRTFEVPHLPTSSQVLPTELNVVGMGEENQITAQATVINDKLQDLRNRLEATREWQRVGAITGKILDHDGRVIYDLYDEFGVVPKSVAASLAAASDVRAKLMEAKRYAEKKLSGFVITGWRAYCDEEYFDALVSHDSVKEAYKGYQEAADRLGGDVRKGFTFGGVEHVEYNAVVGGQKFIAAGKARLVPVVRGLFKISNAPANYNETVGTIGKAFYAKAEPRKLGKGWDLEAQANPLALCLVPEALVGLSAA